MEIQPFADNWSAQIVLVLFVILLPYGITTLLLSSSQHHHSALARENFRIAGIGAVATVWIGFAVCLLDIFFWHTLVITFVAAFGAHAVLIGISAYISWVAKQRYGLTVYINNR